MRNSATLFTGLADRFSIQLFSKIDTPHPLLAGMQGPPFLIEMKHVTGGVARARMIALFVRRAWRKFQSHAASSVHQSSWNLTPPNFRWSSSSRSSASSNIPPNA